jgi:hypothetical protein
VPTCPTSPCARALAAAATALASLAATPAVALSIRAATTGGVMQQPTSHYYLACYGGRLDLATDADGLVMRASYVERPEFRSVGYADKEYGYFALVGTRVTKGKTGPALTAFIGAGRMHGYVARLDTDSAPEGATNRRSFQLPGLSTALEYGGRWHGLDLAVGHQAFIGYVDDEQLDAYVAWPYNFFQVSAGYAW